MHRGNHYLHVIGRLKRNLTLTQAQTAMNTIAQRLEQQYPNSNTGMRTAVVPLHEQIVGSVRLPLLLLLGAICAVLLVPGGTRCLAVSVDSSTHYRKRFAGALRRGRRNPRDALGGQHIGYIVPLKHPAP